MYVVARSGNFEYINYEKKGRTPCIKKEITVLANSFAVFSFEIEFAC